MCSHRATGMPASLQKQASNTPAMPGGIAAQGGKEPGGDQEENQEEKQALQANCSAVCLAVAVQPFGHAVWPKGQQNAMQQTPQALPVTQCVGSS